MAIDKSDDTLQGQYMELNADRLDLQIIEALREDPDLPTRELANRFEVTDKTVLNRIAALTSQLAMTVTMQWNLQALGLDVLGHAFIDPGDWNVPELGDRIAQIPEIATVAEMVGSPALYVYVIASSVKHFYDIVQGISSQAPGIKIVEAEIGAETLKYSPGFSGGVPLNDQWPKLADITPRAKVDEFDFQLMEILQRNARASNREIARRLEVSETMIRQRVKKLTGKGIVQKAVAINPFVLEYTTAAMVRFQVDGDHIDDTCSELTANSRIPLVMKIVGSYNVLFYVFGLDLHSMTDEIYGLLSSDQVIERYSVLPMLRTFKYRHTVFSPNLSAGSVS